MRIGIDCRKIFDVEKQSGGGIERFVFYLVKQLMPLLKKHQVFLFVDRNVSQQTITLLIKRNKAIKIKKVASRIPFISPHCITGAMMNVLRLDVCLFPAHEIPLCYFGKAISTVHDIAIYKHPEWFPEKQWFSSKIVFPWLLRRAKKIVTVSHTTEQALHEIFPGTQDKTVVVYQGIASTHHVHADVFLTMKQKHTLPEKYLLYLGTIEPRKNLIRLSRAVGKVAKKDTAISLVVAGGRGWKFERIEREAERINTAYGRKVITFIGTVTATEKAQLLHYCRAFVFPSLYEGFGVPVFEALSYNKPVLVSRISVFKECVPSVVMADPLSVQSIKQGIQKLLAEPEASRKYYQLGQAVRKKYDWRLTAKAYAALITDQA